MLNCCQKSVAIVGMDLYQSDVNEQNVQQMEQIAVDASTLNPNIVVPLTI